MSMLRELLTRAVEKESSDIHIKTGQVPYFRIGTELVESGFESVSLESATAIVKDLLPEHLKKTFDTEHEADFSHYEENAGRFRVNIFLSRGWPVIALRHVKQELPTVEQLRLPVQIKALSEIQRGVALLSGTISSGKSATLAAVIGEINRHHRRRIITIEDPIEYIFDDT